MVRCHKKYLRGYVISYEISRDVSRIESTIAFLILVRGDHHLAAVARAKFGLQARVPEVCILCHCIYVKHQFKEPGSLAKKVVPYPNECDVFRLCKYLIMLSRLRFCGFVFFPGDLPMACDLPCQDECSD